MQPLYNSMAWRKSRIRLNNAPALGTAILTPTALTPLPLYLSPTCRYVSAGRNGPARRRLCNYSHPIHFTCKGHYYHYGRGGSLLDHSCLPSSITPPCNSPSLILSYWTYTSRSLLLHRRSMASVRLVSAYPYFVLF